MIFFLINKKVISHVAELLMFIINNKSEKKICCTQQPESFFCFCYEKEKEII